MPFRIVVGPRYLKETYACVERQAKVFLGLVSKLPQPRAEPGSPPLPLSTVSPVWSSLPWAQ